jgi:hypothetical protein
VVFPLLSPIPVKKRARLDLFFEKSVLMKPLRYKAVEQKTLSFADLDFRFAGRSPRRSGW